jgi:CO/xanthine dehydrogenase Mo-binding subunit
MDQHIGKSHTSPEVVEKLTGKAVFAGDVRLPGMLHAAIVKSPVPRGTIREIDTSAALALPGVVAVITAADLRREPIGCSETRYGVVVRDRPILASDRVTFVGEPVAAVVAETRAQARTAAAAVLVDVEEQPPAWDLATALAPHAPIVHPDQFEPEDAVYRPPAPIHYGESNAIMTFKTEKGDVEAALDGADAVLEREFTFPAIYQYAVEPYCTVADARANEISVWSSAQHPYQVAKDLARLFGLTHANVHIHPMLIGGGFGSKSFTHIEPLTVALSRAARRPVRLELDIAEATKVSRRHNARARVRVALDEGGNLTAYDAEIHLDGGSYTLLGPFVARAAAFRGLGGYDFPSYRVHSHLVTTNTSPAGSMRAVGGPQGAWGLEVMLDCAARHAGVDPYTYRQRLVADRGQEFRPGRTPMDALLAEDLALLSEQAASRPEPDAAEGVSIGHGMAMGICDPGASPVSTAVCRLASDGSLTVLIGSSELGQGTRAVAAQIAASALGLGLEAVTVSSLDTGRGTYDATTGASRSTIMSGHAVHRAATQIRERLTAMAAEEWACAADEVAIEDGWVRAGERRKRAGDFLRDHFGEQGGAFFGVGEVGWKDFPTTPPFWEVAMAAATVAVDTETGQVRVLGYSSLADVGRVINPVQMRGQEAGALMQGLGHALMESLEFSDGFPLNDSLISYQVPRASDVPRHTTQHFTENADGAGVYGLKGAGEGAIVPVAPAIANAVFDATGVRVDDLPLSPERVWRALRAAGVEVAA